MADHIRFHLDEHVDPAIATALRRTGIDVTTTIEAGLDPFFQQSILGPYGFGLKWKIEMSTAGQLTSS